MQIGRSERYVGMRAAGSKKAEGEPGTNPLANLDGFSFQWIAVKNVHLTMRRLPRSAVSKYWRAHAQATSERVQPRSGTISHQQRPQRISTQLPLMRWIH